MVKSAAKPPIRVTIENVDEPFTKSTTFIRTKSPIQYGRRSENNAQAKRNLSKIIEGNYEYTARKKSSLTSTTTTDDEFGNSGKRLVSSQSLEAPSFVVLREPCKQNKWMKSSWYLWIVQITKPKQSKTIKRPIEWRSIYMFRKHYNIITKPIYLLPFQQFMFTFIKKNDVHQLIDVLWETKRDKLQILETSTQLFFIVANLCVLVKLNKQTFILNMFWFFFF